MRWITVLIGLTVTAALVGCGEDSYVQRLSPDGHFIDTEAVEGSTDAHWGFPGDGSLASIAYEADAIAVVAVNEVFSIDYDRPGPPLTPEQAKCKGIPWSTYLVTVEQWVKGQGPAQILVDHIGGPAECVAGTVFIDGDFLLEPGRKYLLTLNKRAQEPGFDSPGKGEYAKAGAGRGDFEVTDGFVHVLNNPIAQDLFYLNGMPLADFVSLLQSYAPSPAVTRSEYIDTRPISGSVQRPVKNCPPLDCSLRTVSADVPFVAVVEITSIVGVEELQSAFLPPAPNGLFTTYEATVEQWVKGSGGQKIQVAQSGGLDREGRPQIFDGDFLLEPDRRYVLFMKRSPATAEGSGLYIQLYGGHGKLEVTDGYVHALNNALSTDLIHWNGWPLTAFVQSVQKRVELATTTYSSSQSSQTQTKLFVDTDISDNVYTADPNGDGSSADNTITVGDVTSCASISTPSDFTDVSVDILLKSATDVHAVQIRLNLRDSGGALLPQTKARLLTANFSPFSDGLLFQSVGFINLPVDGGAHRNPTTASAFNDPEPNSNLLGATFVGEGSFAVAPDHPSTLAPSGTGVVIARLVVRVFEAAGGELLALDLATAPQPAGGSKVIILTSEPPVFDDQTVILPESKLFDGTIAVGLPCPP